ncbi:hypothetical protein PBI_JEANIE_3 [Gordonia phage Jeanie]|uniref:Uncharacterized protein n=2 Tax=root TaxID=1 RepID=A0A160DHP6_9CAUD|nr:hypothetical protein [Gordonia neofelifaecis]YP_009274015.1 hypothetical protein BH764_gp03 [Gordonia phage McGonagall]ANA87581.1 hypothetical protein MCGONAGALL_3 [Gordonia phage McGonagall]ANA87608.1 hypothetical protein PBI_JEANIE_3 [Gordonia phage Jeanie]EGD53222.1 hypothetical protein SCNU_20082 [Gordonia neofelifaecis NRRL B-59395]
MPKAPTAYTIDSTPYSAVVLCNAPGCSWRGLAHTKPSAYRLVADHLRHAHHNLKASWNAARFAERYNRDVSGTESVGEKVTA